MSYRISPDAGTNTDTGPWRQKLKRTTNRKIKQRHPDYNGAASLQPSLREKPLYPIPEDATIPRAYCNADGSVFQPSIGGSTTRIFVSAQYPLPPSSQSRLRVVLQTFLGRDSPFPPTAIIQPTVTRSNKPEMRPTPEPKDAK